MDEERSVDQLFEANRTHLRSVAYRLLGSRSDADDAVQEAWLRLHRSDVTEVQNLAAWLTTVVSRIALDMLRSRRARATVVTEPHLPDPLVEALPGSDPRDPEREAELADSVGLALLVVLDALAPAERLAFVLHDMFALPFEEIATIVDRTPDAARQLASRARRRVQGAAVPRTDLARQQRVVDAFLAAARGGDFAKLVAVLDPDITLRADVAPLEPLGIVRGAEAVAGQAMMFRSPDRSDVRVLVNGGPGVISVLDGRPAAVLAFTVVDDVIVEIDILADPDRLAALDLPV